MITTTTTPAPAPAAPAPANDSAAAAPAASSNGLPSNDTPADDGLDEEEQFGADLDAFLDQHGSKDIAQSAAVDLDAEVEDAAPAAAAAPVRDEDDDDEEDETPAAPAAAAAPAATPAAAAPGKDPNSYRVNLKESADAETKRLTLQLMKAEPGASMTEIARRVGIMVNDPAAPAAAATPATQPVAAAAPVKSRAQELREQIASLEAEEAKANDDFEFQTRNQKERELRPLYRELDRAEAAEADAARTRAQSSQAVTNGHWTDLAREYPTLEAADSPLHARIQARVNQIEQHDPGYFTRNPDWPLDLTLSEARKLGLSPKATPAAPAPAATAAKPATAPVAPAPVARKPFSPLPAGASHAAAAPAPAYDENDLDSLDAYLDANGTHVG